jgi:aryl-alcohol dehydrogenase-like predicted oxidoreductase
MQNHYNLLNREEEREMLPLCVDQGIGVLPWSPLARGRLTRDWDARTARTADDEYGASLYARTVDADRQVVQRVAELAGARGVPRAQVALAWLAQNPAVTAPIAGVTRPQHLDDAVAAMDLRLTAEEITSLEQPYVPHPVAGFE